MTAPARERESWDLFCRVVDNYGDIGIAWRLARQLAADPARAVRLVVDRLDVFARIEARIDPVLARQTLDGIEVIGWSSTGAQIVDFATIVVEMLGCGLPAAYLAAMAEGATMRPCVWIDFEHLSAQSWVGRFHGLPSPHPALPLTKHFFYPGFGDDTGGLLIEPGLDRRRRAFVDSPHAVDALWRRLSVPAPDTGEQRLLVFAYPDAPWSALLSALATADRWSVLVAGAIDPVATARHVHAIPFVNQDDFDRLLWACDAAFVRGEDSFVRAQTTGRPFAWQIYKQPEDAHRAKLAAFEGLYEAGLLPTAVAAQRRLWASWNGFDGDMEDAMRDWLTALPVLRDHAERWRARLASGVPLVDRLAAFVDARRGSPGGLGLIN